MNAAATIYGGIKNAQAMRDVTKSLEAQKAQNRAMTDNAVYKDYTNTASAQRMFNKVQDALRSRKRQSAATAAVTGSTQEAQALDNAAAMQALANVASDTAINGEKAAQAAQEKGMQNEWAINDELRQMKMKQAQNTAEAVQGVAGAASNVMSMI